MEGDSDFTWGRRTGFGKYDKSCKFYESFTYDGEQYSLYDCVYLQNDGEDEPYVGKLIKIWDKPNQPKMVKIHWFFRPTEIEWWLQQHKQKAFPNELFFASGEGVGLSDASPLEAIVGKCNIVCISKDARNPQPSTEQIQAADYVFCRTFDVGTCDILEDFADKVGNLEAKFVFNREETEKSEFVKDKAECSEGISSLDKRPAKRSKPDVSNANTNNSKIEKKTIYEGKPNQSLGEVPCEEMLVRKQASKQTTGEGNDAIVEGKVIKVSRRPVDDEGRWFHLPPWEERLIAASDQGMLVFLQNLDPEYTSSEVEDIIWHAFREKVDAKVVQWNACSNPLVGQALLIFKSREVADRVVRKLKDGCLLLSDQRPLVGRVVSLPKNAGKQSKFAGHFVIDKLKFQLQKDKDAVSTSHCAQPNTIEHELAMDWCLLQSRSDLWWKTLHKDHGTELKKLIGGLKSY